MKNKLILFLVLCFGFIGAAFTQNDYRNGYVIVNKSDTLYGSINNNGYYDNSQFCEFKDIKTDVVTRFYPDQISGYRFLNGKYYISQQIGDKKLFLEFLINGKLDIYFYQDQMGNNHYYADKDTLGLTELVFEKYIEYKNNKYYEVKNSPFINVLKTYSADCPTIKQKIYEIREPGHVNLIKFAEKYHSLTCKDEKCIVYEKKIPRGIKLAIYGGPALAYYSYSSDQPRVYPTYGACILLQQAQNRERLYIGLGIFNNIKFEDHPSNSFRIPLSFNYLNPRQGFSPTLSYQLDLDVLLLSQALELGCKYQTGKVSLVLNAGLSTFNFYRLYSSTLRFGIMFNLN